MLLVTVEDLAQILDVIIENILRYFSFFEDKMIHKALFYSFFFILKEKRKIKY